MSGGAGAVDRSRIPRRAGARAQDRADGRLRLRTMPRRSRNACQFPGAEPSPDPGVEVHLVEDGGARLPGRLERGETQASIMAAGDDHIHGEPLCPLYLLAATPETHCTARRGTLEITELMDDPLLLLGGGYASREWLTLLQGRSKRPRVLLESIAPQNAIALAGAGDGSEWFRRWCGSCAESFAPCLCCTGACRSADGRSSRATGTIPGSLCRAVRRGNGG